MHILGSLVELSRRFINQEIEKQGSQLKRKWRLWQIESSFACNLKCTMCPWIGIRDHLGEKGLLQQQTWEVLIPFLGEVQSIDFTGGGEPLLQKNLLSWIQQAKSAGCEVGFLTNGLLLNENLSTSLIEAQLDWIGFSIDGADSDTYEAIRLGSDFEKVCTNIQFLTSICEQVALPLVMINFVILPSNCHQLEDIVKLAGRLKVNQINFKQCDVIRGEHGKGLGVFTGVDSKQIKQLEKSLRKACRLAEKLGLKTTVYPFSPDEQPVCDQDPRNSLFIRADGSVHPCINLAYGGPSSFLGKEILFPTLSYGNLLEEDLLECWESESSVQLRKVFQQRIQAYNRVLGTSDYGNSLHKLKEVFNTATKAMPEAPEGCRACHYLYDV